MEQRVRLLEEQTRRAKRRDLTAWCHQAGFQPAAHHRLLLRELANPDTKRLMVMMPPGAAKSTYSSVLFPPWLMANVPGINLLGISHTAMLANQFSKRVQRQVQDNSLFLGARLASESADLWHTSNGSQYRSAGSGGGISGFRADVAILDDPIKGREEADSELQRDKIWNWYRSDLTTRMRPGNRIIIVNTRWHEDDLCGRLLDVEPEKWRVIKFPAQALADDPLGRAPGEYLWSDDAYGYGDLLRETHDEHRRAGAMRDWSALYQQDPRPGEGALFRTEKIQTLDAYPMNCSGLVRAWDMAATEQVGTRNPDWTVGLKMGRLPSGGFVVLDIVRLRGGPDEVEQAIVNTAQLDGHACRIGLAQDPAQAGKFQVAYYAKRLAGHMLEISPELGDKDLRAAPVASQVNAGNMAMVRAPWNTAFLQELSGFPSGQKDDQVDAFSRAFSVIGLGASPMRINPAVMQSLGLAVR